MDVCPRCGEDMMCCSSWRLAPEWLCVCLACKHEWTAPDFARWVDPLTYAASGPVTMDVEMNVELATRPGRPAKDGG